MEARSAKAKPVAQLPGLTGKGYSSEQSNEYKLRTANIMFDPRVVRGNTWSASTLAKIKQTQTTTTKFASTRKPRVAKPSRELTTPRPVEGRQHIELQTDGYLEDVVEATAGTQADLEALPEESEPAVPNVVSCDATTQIEEGDLPDVEAQAKAKAALEAQYWAAIEEEQQRAAQRQLAAIEQARREEAARLRTLAEEQGRQAAKEQQLYADEHQSFKLAFEFTTGLVDIAAEAAKTAFLFEEADAAAVEQAKKARANVRLDLSTLLSAAERDLRTFSIRCSARFEAMVLAISNGAEVPEEEIDQVLRRQTI